MRQALAALDVLRGKYRIERIIGRGGMGTVHLATHLAIGQRVAIKIVRPSERDHEYVVARFLREARAAALLQSDHVVRILDVDAAEDGSPFMVMEYLEGMDLGAMLKQGGRFAPVDAVLDVLEACEALAEAHARGIVHRDLKPSNLFRAELPRGPTIKLLDFGISKIVTGEEDLALTDTKAVMGSPLFMSPEQLLSSRDVDHRSDVWSLGVTLYQLLSGEIPFEASSASGLGAQIAAREPRPLSHSLPGVSKELEEAVMRCLRRDPADRYASVVDFARALAPLVPEHRRAPAITAVERAQQRGLRDRNETSSPEAAIDPPPAIEASGERWTRSRMGTEPPKSATPEPLPPSVPIAVPIPASLPPAPRSRIGLVVAFVAILITGIAFVVAYRVMKRPEITVTPAATQSIAPAKSSPPQPDVSASASASTPSAIPTTSETAKRAPVVRPAPKPTHGSAKDPSELELK